jgi:predicted KAP-like P-loop ATPase
VVETLEAIRLFVFTSRTAFVVAADEEMIEYAVRRHFPELKDSTGPQSYARSYLEKLIQIPFRIPALGEAETRIYVSLLLIGAEIGEGDEAFKKLIQEARNLLKRPWTGAVLDINTVKTTLGDKFSSVQNALTLTDQIGPSLASGTRGNPRQIKRFLNAIALRKRIADARGFGDEIKIPVLAKLMLAERFLVRTFDQIATAAAVSPKGVCEELTQLEADQPQAAAEAPSKAPAQKTSEAKSIVSPKGTDDGTIRQNVLEEWMSSPAVREWAQVQPPLAGIDLRPYLFVAKDRKDYFGPNSILGRLAVVADQLFGPKLAIQAMESDLKALALPEAAQIFGAVRARIISSDVFDRQPAGVDGLMILVKAHPNLQNDLLTFLEGLPDDRLGAWVVQGWQGVIKDTEHVTRLTGLLTRWSQCTNPLLKVAAASVLKVSSKGR